MAEDKKPDSNGLTTALPVTVVLAMLAGLFFMNSLPYQDERPSNRSVSSSHTAAQDVDARLWQDPFAAIKDANEENQTEKFSIVTNHNSKLLQLEAIKQTVNSSPHSPGQIYEDYTPAAKDEITIIAVTLPGGPYQEDEEQRMRRRYAVLSALANQGATPDDEQHIGYFQPNPKPDMVLPKKVAFEWWSLPDDKSPPENNSLPDGKKLPINKKKVLLLWVDESSLFGHPAAKLKALLGQTCCQLKDVKSDKNSLSVTQCTVQPDEMLCQASCQKEPPKAGASNPYQKTKKPSRQTANQETSRENVVFNYAVIGPNTSTLLRELLKEVKKDTKKTTDKYANPPYANTAKSILGKFNGQDIVYYSAEATASDKDLLKGIKETTEGKTDETVSGYLGNLGVTLHRTTATDDAMMMVLVDELDVRRVKKPDQIVILSEWDTFYGRAMPEAFKEAFKKAWGDKDKNEEPVHVYGYMRGLDGKLPDKNDKSGSGAEKKSDNKDKSGVNAPIEFPEGQNQKDYLRRLANTINELDRHLKEDEDNPKGVAAIGILGSDVHDKLMILEALRQHFPHQLFFTTGLDAAYSHPDKWRQTHNLLVASAFDLMLRPELQDRIPPFRDSSQTAFFLATQLALKKEINITDLIMPPRLFEIGRSRPVPVPMNDDKVLPTHLDNNDAPKCSWKKEEWPGCKNTVQPKIFATSQLRWKPAGILIVVFVAGLLFLVSRWIREKVTASYKYCQSHPYSAICIGVAPLLLVYLLMLVWNAYMMRPYAEPFYWREGLSVWPSQLLRLSAGLFAVGFYFWGNKRIKSMQSELQAPSSDKHKQAFALLEYFSPLKDRNVLLVAQYSDKHKQTFALPDDFSPLKDCNVLFVGNWIPEENNEQIDPDVLWQKYLAYCRQKKWIFPGWVWRVMLQLFLIFVAAFSLMSWSGYPNEPVRGLAAWWWNFGILRMAVFATIILSLWVVDNARLCNRLIANLSAKPSEWNDIAKKWAINDNKVAQECVDDWLDIKLVTCLTATMQQLIWGPVACIGLMMLARSPVFDDWDIPWGLRIVFIAMLIYAISAEVFLQHGARSARTKAINQLTEKIREQLNLEHPNKAAIKRIETEIERINMLRDGAFRPWYEWPLLQSFGGVGTLVLIQQYITELLGGGAL